MSSEVNRCPFCDEEVRVMALKCKHCGSTLDDASNMADSRRGVRIKDRAAKHKKRAEDYKKGGGL